MSTHVMPDLIEPKWIGIIIYNIMEGVTGQILYGSLVPGLSMMEGHGPWLSILECPGPWPSILEKILHIGAIWIRSFHSGESWIGAGQHGRSWNWPPWLLTFADDLFYLLSGFPFSEKPVLGSVGSVTCWLELTRVKLKLNSRAIKLQLDSIRGNTRWHYFPQSRE